MIGFGGFLFYVAALVCIAVVVIVIVFYVQLCQRMSEIAQKKGEEKKKAFWYCLLFGVLGFLYVIALPDKNISKNATAVNECTTPKEATKDVVLKETVAGGNVKIIFDNSFKDEDFYIQLSGRNVFNGIADEGKVITAECKIGQNNINLCNSFSSKATEFAVKSNMTTEIHIRSVLSFYKVASIEYK